MKRWTDTEYVDAYQRYMAVPGTIVSLDDHERALAEKDAEYQQLMAQAIRFARCLAINGVHSEAGDFLQLPEAQAFLKEQQS